MDDTDHLVLGEGDMSEGQEQSTQPMGKDQPAHYRRIISSGRFTWERVVCISALTPCAQALQNIHDLHHGTMAILSMGYGHPRTPFSGSRKGQVCDRGNYFTKWIEAKPLARITGKEAHWTSIKQGNGETPFSLTYRSEAVIPAEIGMPTYQTMMIREGFNDEELCLNLDLLTKKRELAAIREARYRTEMIML
ncbi:hypothetical protein Tco_0854868 [Tanacetum coccineum]